MNTDVDAHFIYVPPPPTRNPLPRNVTNITFMDPDNYPPTIDWLPIWKNS